MTPEAWQRLPLDASPNRAAVTPFGVVALGVGPRGVASRVWVSPDGLSWDEIPAGALSGWNTEFVSAEVAATPDGAIIIQVDQMWRSVDGGNWSGPTTITNGRFNPAGLASADGIIFAIGTSQSTAESVWSTPEGGPWEQVASDPGGFEHGGMNAVATNGTVTVAAGSIESEFGPLEERVAAIVTSVDGGAWERATLPPVSAGRGANLTDVTWDRERGQFVAVGWDGVGDQDQRTIAMSSPDGITWMALQPATFDSGGHEQAAAIVVDRGRFLIGGENETGGDQGTGIVWFSSDGDSWERADIERNAEIHDVAILGDTCMAFGRDRNGGAVWTGPCDSLATLASE